MLMAIGLIGTVLPIFPGPAVIFAAAILHRSILGTEKSIGWPSILVLLFLALASYAIDFAGGWLGARRFGATRWGMLGAAAGAILGLFFGLPGLLLGPVLGALTGEIIGGKQLVSAGRAGWGASVRQRCRSAREASHRARDGELVPGRRSGTILAPCARARNSRNGSGRDYDDVLA